MADVDPKVIGPVIWPRQKQDEATRQWWRRTSMRTKDFSLGEMERVIDYLLPLARRRGETKARRLPGFPFIEIDESERVEFGTHGSARAPLDEGTSPGE